MIQTLYRGSVKDVLGPISVATGQSLLPAILFQYSDAYSVFDWGRMPDALPGKGAALATLAAHWFEKIESPATWKDFSRAPEALKLRKGNRWGASFNEIGEELQSRGLRTHYLGVSDVPGSGEVLSGRLSERTTPARHLLARQVSVVPPKYSAILGRQIPDYLPTRSSPAPRLVPLEVVFRFGFPKGASIYERVERDPGYLASIGYPDLTIGEGPLLDFPVLEMFTKLEPSDRPVGLVEALAISGLSAEQLRELLLKTVWVAGFLRGEVARAGFELADGKLEWALDESGRCFLVDAIGPDELRISKEGIQLSKEFLRGHYRATRWYEAVQQAKARAGREGISEWKRMVAEGPPPLPPKLREVAEQLYPALTNALSGRDWFSQAWPVNEVVARMKALEAGGAE